MRGHGEIPKRLATATNKGERDDLALHTAAPDDPVLTGPDNRRRSAPISGLFRPRARDGEGP
jgi:hypothetical protein